ncbi:ParA family protein [Fusobacterium animalis]|jgi:ATPases involved in chromosome partitioning|uniref:ParA family protein n=1 Tax=Fusobacterium animalis TaxID=76859 RepID=UPI003558B90F
MNAKVISFMNMKGGVGKTMLCANFAYTLKKLKNKKVLVIDMDPQSNTSQYIIPKDDYGTLMKEGKTIIQLYSSIDDEIDYSAVSLTEKNDNKEIDIINTVNEGFDIILGDLKMVRLSNSTSSTVALELKNFLSKKKLLEKYDYILIDCPPTQSIYTESAMLVSDYYILPLKPDFFSEIGISIMKNIIKKYNRTAPKRIKSAGVIINMVHRNTYEKNMIKQIKDKNQNDVYEKYLYYSSEISSGVEHQKYIIDIKGNKNNFKSIINEFLERTGETE